MAMIGQPVRTSISKHHEEKGESATRPMPGATVLAWAARRPSSIGHFLGPGNNHFHLLRSWIWFDRSLSLTPEPGG